MILQSSAELSSFAQLHRSTCRGSEPLAPAGSRARVGSAALVEAVLGFILLVGSFPPDALDLAFGKPHSRVKHFSFCLRLLM